MKIIDPHIHLFDLDLGQYNWLRPDCPPFWPDKSKIRRHFSDIDLALGDEYCLDGFVHIEAGFDNEYPEREIAWLEQSCASNFRAIAAIDLTLPRFTFQTQLNRLSKHKSVVGVRHILDEDVLEILGNKNVESNLHQLASLQWIFELQFDVSNHEHLNKVMRIFSKFPDLKLTLNHVGSHLFNGEQTDCEAVYENYKRLSSLTNIAVKCSGWEMQKRHYELSDINSILHRVITIFGINRVMLASNFPLCLFRISYKDYWCGLVESNYINDIEAEKTMHCSRHCNKALFHDNAFTWYGFDIKP